MDIANQSETNHGVRPPPYVDIHRLLKQYELSNSLGGPSLMLASMAEAQQLDSAKTSSSSAVSSALANFILHRENTVGDKNFVDSNKDRPTSILNEILSLRHAIPVQPFPMLTPNDRTIYEKQETVLEGEYIACFAVGGEKRLCLPQVLGTVLKNCSMIDINRARNDLSIHCNHCTIEQLNVLKSASILSSTATSCGLITKTDAERLCNHLLRQEKIVKRERRTAKSISLKDLSQTCPSSGLMEASKDDSVPIMHLCFGRCRGRYRPSLYASPSAECIECEECGDLFAPDRFVMHSHRNQERRTCHWGFDSANWRAYIHLPSESETSTGNIELLERMKLRFDVNGLTKRKLDGGEANTSDDGALDNPTQLKKRIKLDPQTCDQQSLTMEKLAAINPIAGTTTTATFPYLLCDPTLVMAYYRSLLSSGNGVINGAATASSIGNPILAAVHHQLSAGNIAKCAPPPPAGGIDLELLAAAAAAASKSVEPIHNLDFQQLQFASQLPLVVANANRTTTTTSCDEATAAAALKLLQLSASCGDNGNFVQDEAMKSSCDSSPSEQSPQPRQTSTPQSHHHHHPIGKEPYKKHLLHLFVEQQQKEQQHQQQQQNGRESVEVIVDGDDEAAEEAEDLSDKRAINECTSISEEKLEIVEDARVSIDDSSASSSDTEGTTANEEMTLDELLKHFIPNDDGRRMVRAKIATNQRYLEQKMDSISSENRLLRTECFQLRTKQMQMEHQQQQQQHNAAAAGLSFLNLLQKPLMSFKIK